MRLPVWSILVAVAAGCNNNNNGGTAPDLAAPEPAAAVVARWLTGRFDSRAQAQADRTYQAVTLVICKVSIDKIPGRTLYVEQALAGTPRQPYRQRIYLVEPRPPEAEHALSRVFEPVDAAPLVGLCDQPAPRPTLKADDLFERDGCNVDLQWKTDHYEGGTTGKDCPSTLNGATYATSQAWLYADRMESWDRGFDSDDKQVWGATKGPYRFDRKTPVESD